MMFEIIEQILYKYNNIDSKRTLTGCIVNNMQMLSSHQTNLVGNLGQ